MKNSAALNIKKFYDLMLEQNLSEMEYREDDFYIFLKRKTTHTIVDDVDPKQELKATPTETSDAPLANGETVKSPINGVFYRASTPKSPPFVNEGDTVEAGKLLCIIEAMKVMNEIKADRRMKILKILVENGKIISQGQAIFAFE